jgi:hypothetical protein
MTVQFFETLRSLGNPAGRRSVHHRQTTIHELENGHPSVLAQFRAKPGRWVLTIETCRYICADCGKETSQFIQFMALEDGVSVIGECVSNTFLDADHAFTPDEERALQALGWNDPLPPHEPNWFFEAASDADLIALCNMTSRTLREILGHGDHDVISVSFCEIVVAPEITPTEEECA